MEPESSYINGEYIPKNRNGGKKKLVIISVVVLAVLALAVLAVCLLSFANKTPATAEEFIAAAEARGLACRDDLDEFQPSDRALLEAGLCASADGWQVEFYQLTGTSAANRYFSNVASLFDSEVPGPSSHVSVSMNGYASYALTAPNGSWYFVSGIGSTVLIAVADSGYKEAAKEMIQALGY